MRIAFFSSSLRFSGGRLITLRHANELARRGHDVSVWIPNERPVLDWMESNVPIRGYSPDAIGSLPKADLCVFDRPKLASSLVGAKLGRVVHYCQGFEGTDTELRLRSVWSRRNVLGVRELWKLWRRLRQIDAAYRLPTAKLVNHGHLGELIARRYGQRSHFVPCSLPAGVFSPPERRASTSGPATVLVVGPSDVKCKRIGDALAAVHLLKKRADVRLVRIAQHPMREAEKSLGVTDEYHTMLSPAEMAHQYRSADVLLVSSDESEGFGLPALEAMACGLPCVLTDIPAFRSFARPDDYARFVPVGDPTRMAGALESLLASGPERRRLSERGLEVAEGYSARRAFDSMEDALIRIASAPEALARCA